MKSLNILLYEILNNDKMIVKETEFVFNHAFFIKLFENETRPTVPFTSIKVTNNQVQVKAPPVSKKEK